MVLAEEGAISHALQTEPYHRLVQDNGGKSTKRSHHHAWCSVVFLLIAGTNVMRKQIRMECCYCIDYRVDE